MKIFVGPHNVCALAIYNVAFSSLFAKPIHEAQLGQIWMSPFFLSTLHDAYPMGLCQEMTR